MLELERRTFQSTMNQEKKREGINLCKDEAKRGTVLFFLSSLVRMCSWNSTRQEKQKTP